MANLRVIKKDIDYIINEVITDCAISLHMNPEKNSEEVMNIINSAVDLRHSLYHKVNHPDKTNIKAYYRGVTEELFSKADELFDRLSKK